MKKANKILLLLFIIFGSCLIYISVVILRYCNLGIPCIFHEVTGLYCPGCGITRCLLALSHLEFYQAFRYNILVFLLLPFFIIAMIYKGICWWFDKPPIILEKIPSWVWYALLAIAIIYGILRNIPFFSFLAPMD